MDRSLVKGLLIVLMFTALMCAVAGHSPAKQALIDDTTARGRS